MSGAGTGADEHAAPRFREIAARLREQIRDGSLRPGSRLPSQESLAAQFKVARGTVQQALRELRRSGLITSQRGSGTFVSGGTALTAAGRVLGRDASPASPASPAAASDTGNGGGSGNGIGIGRASGIELRPEPSAHPAPLPGPRMAAGQDFLTRLMSNALSSGHVTIDYYGFTADPLLTSLYESFAKIRSGEYRPESLTIRMVLPTPGVHLALPQLRDDPSDLRPIEAKTRTRDRRTEDLVQRVDDLVFRRKLPTGAVRVREVPITPVSKLYLLNGREALTGFYMVDEGRIRVAGGEVLDHVFDLEGFDAYLFRNVRDERRPGSVDSRFVDEAQRWFDNIWNTIATEPVDRSASPTD